MWIKVEWRFTVARKRVWRGKPQGRAQRPTLWARGAQANLQAVKEFRGGNSIRLSALQGGGFWKQRQGNLEKEAHEPSCAKSHLPTVKSSKVTSGTVLLRLVLKCPLLFFYPMPSTGSCKSSPLCS